VSLYPPPLGPDSPRLTDRPPIAERKFHSEAVERTIAEVRSSIGDQWLGEMFGKCFANTLDTTVHFTCEGGVPDAYIITGDIDAMWLRDSSAQVHHYVPLAREDAPLGQMINGLIRRQSRCILSDPYANAFYEDPSEVGEWQSDHTEMRPGVHERKWELDSLSYAIRLAHAYWKATDDVSAFDGTWLAAMEAALRTMREQQRKIGNGGYSFERTTNKNSDTAPGAGWGNPWRPTGMICSTFRNSDDAAVYLFNIPENLFAVTGLRQLAEMLTAVQGPPALASEAIALADEVEAAVKEHGIVEHPKHGRIYAYECDGFGNVLFMDDAGLPSLISIPYLGYGTIEDELYRNTRRFVLSEDNPYFYAGEAAEGTGSPHLIAYGDFIWPMGISSRGLTTRDPAEISKCIRMLASTTAGSGFMHEGFDKDNAEIFTRPWFAWSNALFGELVWKTFRENRELLDKRRDS
jgi:meiotically up-regulated gene 157 (Mug157) protein